MQCFMRIVDSRQDYLIVQFISVSQYKVVSTNVNLQWTVLFYGILFLEQISFSIKDWKKTAVVALLSCAPYYQLINQQPWAFWRSYAVENLLSANNGCISKGTEILESWTITLLRIRSGCGWNCQQGHLLSHLCTTNLYERTSCSSVSVKVKHILASCQSSGPHSRGEGIEDCFTLYEGAYSVQSFSSSRICYLKCVTI